MSAKSSKKWILTSAFVVALTACGGGGDDSAGAPVTFSLTPSELTWTYAGAADCSGAAAPATVLINGGGGNYVVTSTSAAVTVSQPYAVNGVYRFDATKATTSCFESIPIQVNDVRGNVAQLIAKAASS